MTFPTVLVPTPFYSKVMSGCRKGTFLHDSFCGTHHTTQEIFPEFFLLTQSGWTHNFPLLGQKTVQTGIFLRQIWLAFAKIRLFEQKIRKNRPHLHKISFKTDYFRLGLAQRCLCDPPFLIDINGGTSFHGTAYHIPKLL